MRRAVIIVAGGTGKRMGVEKPKQFLDLGGRPMIFHTIEIFLKYDNQIEVIVGLQDEYLDYWKNLCKDHSFKIIHRVSPGGKTRFHTVQNALPGLGENSVVAVHDAVRPLVSIDTIEGCFQTATSMGTAVPCIEIPDSVRRIEGKRNSPVDRSVLRMIQTPQVFQLKILKEAYKLKYRKGFTDDASVVEQAGYPVNLVAGNRENIKITTRTDYLMAEKILTESG